jgi:hypothetical protein
MGDRANYLIVQDGKLSVFFANWGGPTVPRDVKDGPQACERCIRDQEPVESNELLDFAYMEGGVALDKDQRRALIFGGPPEVNYGERVQQRLLGRLRPAWEKEGWTIAWARRYGYDLAEFLGIAPERLEPAIFLGDPVPLEKLVTQEKWTATVVARRAGSGWDVRASSHRAGGIVALGEALLAAFDNLPKLDAANSKDLQGVTGLLFDPAARTLGIVAPLFGSLSSPHRLAERARAAFEGWTVELDLDLSSHIERMRARGLELPAAEKRDDSLTDAEVDAIIDAALAYRPEEQIAAMERAAEQAIEHIVGDAKARGAEVTVKRRTRGPTADAIVVVSKAKKPVKKPGPKKAKRPAPKPKKKPAPKARKKPARKAKKPAKRPSPKR